MMLSANVWTTRPFLQSMSTLHSEARTDFGFLFQMLVKMPASPSREFVPPMSTVPQLCRGLMAWR